METADLGPIVAECFKAIYTPLGGQTKKRDALSPGPYRRARFARAMHGGLAL